MSNRPHFEPQPDNSFRIVHSGGYYALSSVMLKIKTGELSPEDAKAQLKDMLRKYPWHFEAALRLSEYYTQEGAFEEACDVRFRACQHLMELLPEEEDAEPVVLDFENKETLYPLLLLQGSAIDHFLACDFEMAAALLETLLDMDEEDHLDVSQTLAYCYVALDEQDSLEAVLSDLDDKSPEKMLVRIWAQKRFGGSVEKQLTDEFKKKFPDIYREFISEEHPVTEAYLSDIDSERPSPEARARLLWLKTEHLWMKYPELPEALKG